MGNKAADLHGVPRSTLKDRLSGRVQHGTKPGPAPYLSKAEESELSAHLVHVANMGYGKTQRDVKCVCFGNYNDDLDTTREWLQCKCDRWIP